MNIYERMGITSNAVCHHKYWYNVVSWISNDMSYEKVELPNVTAYIVAGY